MIVTAQFMVILDVAVVNVALPSIQVDLGFSQSSLQWVISAYANHLRRDDAAGWPAGRPARARRMFIAGCALFAVSSLLCGLAWSEGSLIALPRAQGLGGALLVPPHCRC